MKPRIEDELALLKREVNRLNYRIEVLERQILKERQIEIREAYTEDPFNTVESDTHILDEIDRDAGKVFGHKNLEVNIGKNIMSIIASMLVFIGICGFVALVIQNASDVVRMIVMYICSFAFYGVGIWALRHKKDTLSLSLTGCGIGAVYISLLITHFYFNMMNEIILGIALISWSILALVLAKRVQSDLFCAISYLGYTTAIVLGTFVLGDIGTTVYSHIVAIILALSFTVFTLKICNDTEICSLKLKYIVYAISVITSGILMNSVDSIHEVGNVYSLIDCIPALIVCYMMLMWVRYFKNEAKYQVTVGFIAGLSFIIQMYALAFGMMDTPIDALIPFILIGIQLIFERMELDDQIHDVYRYVSMLMALMISLIAIEKYIIAIAIIGIFMLLRRYKYIEFSITQAFIYLIIYTIAMYNRYDAQWIYSLVLIPFWGCIVYRMLQEYYLWHKIVLYFHILISSALVIASNMYTERSDTYLAIMYIAICIQLITVGLSGIATEWKDKSFIIKKDDSEYDILFYINHVIQYLWIGYGMVLMELANINSMTLFIIVLATFILCISDLHYIIDGRNDGVAILSELKYTLTTCYGISLYLPDDTGYILSIICIIVAITSIYFGFKIKFKGFRIYGLGLSLFAVLKLCLYDIYINEPLIRIGSFILAGILCFIIVFIYNKLSESDNNEIES